MVRVHILATLSDDPMRRHIARELEGSRADVEVVDDADLADRIVVVASPPAAMDATYGRQLHRILGRVDADEVAIVLTAGDLSWSADALSTNALPAQAAARFREPPLYIDARADAERATAHLVEALVGDVAPPVGAAPPPAAPPTQPAAAPPPTPPPPPPGSASTRPSGRPLRRRRGVVLAGVVVVLVVVVGVSFALLNGGQSGDVPSPTSVVPPTTTPSGGGDGLQRLITLVVAPLALVVASAAVILHVARWRRRTPTRLDDEVPDGSSADATEPLDVVFVSYATHDYEVAARLVGDLRPEHNVWFARDSLEPGEQWIFDIDRSLRRSKAFVLLLSAAALRSRWVREEMSVAYLLEVERDAPRIIPIEIEPCDAPILLRTRQMLRLDDGYDEVLTRLQRALM